MSRKWEDSWWQTPQESNPRHLVKCLSSPSPRMRRRQWSAGESQTKSSLDQICRFGFSSKFAQRVWYPFRPVVYILTVHIDFWRAAVHSRETRSLPAFRRRRLGTERTANIIGDKWPCSIGTDATHMKHLVSDDVAKATALQPRKGCSSHCISPCRSSQPPSSSPQHTGFWLYEPLEPNSYYPSPLVHYSRFHRTADPGSDSTIRLLYTYQAFKLHDDHLLDRVPIAFFAHFLDSYPVLPCQQTPLASQQPIPCISA